MSNKSYSPKILRAPENQGFSAYQFFSQDKNWYKNSRPDPDHLLAKIAADDRQRQRGKLKIFFGACPGVGKTYDMLLEAKLQLDEGIDVISGIVETHGRVATEKLLNNIPQIPLLEIDYQGIKLFEPNLNAILQRKPQLVLIDELAHSNAPGLRHPKRWNDVEEILAAGIDVYSTLNVQHLESQNDLIESITGVKVSETVPDAIFDNADDIVLVDIDADELLSRLKKGKVYINPQISGLAQENFFKKENIISLRELALRRSAERVDAEMEDYIAREGIRENQAVAKKIIVCIGADSLSAKLVRSAKRMANSLKVPWIAVYVENSRHRRLSDRERAIVESYFRMAKRNGADTVILYGENAVSEILSYARFKAVDKIIVGKSNKKSRLRDIIQGSLAEKLIRKSGSIDVYVITSDVDDESIKKGFRVFKISDLGNYSGALTAVIICTLFGKIFDKFFAPIDQIMIYLIGAVLVASSFGRGSSILFSLLSVSCFNFFFIEPRYTFSVINQTYWLTFLVMLMTSLFISSLAAKLSSQVLISRKREMNTQRFYELTKELVSVRGHQKIAAIAAEKIGASFNAEIAIWLQQENSADNLSLIFGESIAQSLNEKEKSVAIWCAANALFAGRGSDTMPSASGLYLPLMILEKVIGVMAIYPRNSAKNFTVEEKSALETFASLLSSSLSRASIAVEAEETRLKAETEKLRNILLSSVSHDLRTPLASIIGASDNIFSNFANLKKDDITTLAKSINSEAERLSRIVRNLLDVTNIELGNLQLNCQPYYIQEIIGSALIRMKDILQDHQVNVVCEDNLPLALIDGVLMEQVFTNLLENADKYTPPGSLINISVKREKRNLLIIIEDNGAGIIKKIEESSSRSGHGLGLIICHGIIKLHGSFLKIENSALGGAKFSFILPGAEPIPEITENEK